MSSGSPPRPAFREACENNSPECKCRAALRAALRAARKLIDDVLAACEATGQAAPALLSSPPPTALEAAQSAVRRARSVGIGYVEMSTLSSSHQDWHWKKCDDSA